MIPITKGTAPRVLARDGKAFQDAAVRHAADADYDPSYRKHFLKHARTKADGSFFGFASKLFSLYSFYSDPTVKRQLIEEHHGKCAFCECFIMDSDVGDVEHYRPKAEITVAKHAEPSGEEGVTTHPGYFWLSQTWSNLLLSCKQCNQAYKGNLFDVFPGGMVGQAGVPYPRLSPAGGTEYPYLINPAVGAINPRDFIRFQAASGKAIVLNFEAPNPDQLFGMACAQRTIEIVGLNRPRLVQARVRHLVFLRGLFALVVNGGIHPQGGPLHVVNFRPVNDAGADALTMLKWSMTPAAEFSALAIDALADWSSALEVQTTTVAVPHGDPITVRVSSALVRLATQVELLKTTETERAEIPDKETEPDTGDLDVQYNDLLDKYKKLVRDLASSRRKFKKVDEAATAIRREMSVLSKKIEAVDGWFEEQSEILDACNGAKWDFTVATTFVSRPPGMTEFKTDDENLKKALVAVATDPRSPEEKMARLRASIEAWHGKWAAIDAERGKRAEYRRDLDMKLTVLENKLADVEAPTDAAYTVMFDIFVDADDLFDAYKHCGADTQQRLKRVAQLRDAASAVLDFIDGVPPAEAIKPHFAKAPKGWPPKIMNV